MNYPEISRLKLVASSIAIGYVWMLPVLATLGFAEKGGTSISEFIANPHATGAMAVSSFIPLNLVLEYQEYQIKTHQRGTWITLVMFLLSYGAFLICTVNYTPLIHSVVVALFGVCFIIHSMYIICYINPSHRGKIVLSIGILAFASLLLVNGMWFWMMECIGFSCMVLFTPVELYQSSNVPYELDDKSGLIQCT